MAAPVVPTHEASAAPIVSSAAFDHGVARSDPRTWMPPPIVNSVAKSTTNGR